MKLIIITLCVFYITIVFGLIYSYNIAIKRGAKRVKLFNQRLPLILLNVALISGLTTIGLAFLQNAFSLSPSPNVENILFQFFIYLIVDDFCFYTWHRALHKNKYLLRKIHRVHHQARNPIPLEYLYVHPLEWMGGMSGVVIPMIIIYFIFGTINAYPFWLFSFFRSLRELRIHSGQPSKLFNHIPFFQSNEAHELHHTSARGNYASMLSYLDHLLKTEIEQTDQSMHL